MGKIKICDAICGAGKTSAAISMMNRETDKKFIFVSQYLTEVERIENACASRGFVSPKPSGAANPTKLSDIERLIKDGVNIATTHMLFLSYTDEIKRILKQQQYTLVLDEVVTSWADASIEMCDVKLLKKAGIIHQQDDDEGETMKLDWSEYSKDSGKFREEVAKSRAYRLKCFENKCFFWTMAPELFTCFDDVYVLTYLFPYQPLRCFFDIHHLEYELIGTQPVGDHFEFCDISMMNRARDLKSKIHILDKPKLNAIGDDRAALSYSWTQRQQEVCVKIRNNIRNVFLNIWGAKSEDVMWTTYKEFSDNVKPLGYANGFVPFNKRASNEFANRRYLAYCVNVFPNPFEYRYYKANGVDLDGDMYAVSTLVQWMFRSAIRNGEDIYLYLPSLRMRSLLTQWLDNLAEGRDLDPVSYRMPHKSNYIPVAQRKKRGRKRNDN